MNVIINGMAAIEQKTGVGHYIERVHQEIARTIPATLFPGDLMRPVAAKLAPQARQLRTINSTGTRSWKSLLSTIAKESGRAAAQAYFSTYTTANRFDLYHEPNYIPFRTHLPTVVTAHDLSVLLHPEWHPADRVKIHETKFTKAVEDARHVITGSEQVRRELLATIPLPPEKVTAVYYGIGEEFHALPEDVLAEARQRLRLPDRFFLYVGAVEPRKNLMVALRAFVDLPAELRAKCPFLLAGPWAWKTVEVAEYFEHYAGPAGARHLGYVSDADRVALYNAATALVYPSRYEGFGLPPVEMMACGGAVLAGTALAVKEVLGDHATFLDPDDVAGWQAAMTAIIREPESIQAGRDTRIAHAKQYTWARCAAETHAVYRKAIAGSIQRAAA